MSQESRPPSCSCTSVLLPVAFVGGGLLGLRYYGGWGAVIGSVAAIPALGLLIAAIALVAKLAERKRR
ncbi:MAG: hypothetical protein U0S12_15160 [Fimbriimonadales bacterium]